MLLRSPRRRPLLLSITIQPPVLATYLLYFPVCLSHDYEKSSLLKRD